MDRLAATPSDGEQRRLAEGEYHFNRPAIEAEQRRQGAVEAAEYRAGTRWTPTGPSWNVTAVTLTGYIATHVREVGERFDRTIGNTRDLPEPRYARGMEHGFDELDQRLARPSAR